MAAAASRLQQLAAIAIVSAILSAAATDAAAPAPAPAAPAPASLRHRAFLATLDDATGGEQDGGSGTGAGAIAECWSAVTQLGSCTNEILLFFFNGESYIGPECCHAIRGATQHCWPPMLASFGFSVEQADVLRGFCEGEADAQQAAAGSSDAPPPGTKQ